MQTFLPYKSFVASAKVLDNKRLGKQRVEAYQILNTLLAGPLKDDGKKRAWYNHPATQMWKGYEVALSLYGLVICAEWIARGYKDSLYPKFYEYFVSNGKNFIMPPWLGWETFHLSHRSNLIRKDFDYYSVLFNMQDNTMSYIWPSKVMNS